MRRRHALQARRSGTFALAAVLGLAASVPAAAAEPPILVEPGTKGLVRVPFEAVNRTGGPLACAAALAHWYSAEIGRAGPGEAVVADLWSDPASGAVYLLNARQERMPVLSLWCGRGEGAASTRADIRLERRQGAAEPAVHIACRDPEAGAARPECRREGEE